jgi:hypothetical protein
MASTNNNKEKMPSEDDRQYPKLKEEVESEAEEEEIEEDQSPCPRAALQALEWRQTITSSRRVRG